MLAGAVGILSIVVQYVPSLILAGWTEGEWGSALPIIGTVGESVALYNLLANIVGPLMTLTLAVGLGYYLSSRIDIAHEYRRVGTLVTIRSTAPVATVFLGEAAISASKGGFSSATWFSLVLLIVSFVSVLVSIIAPITVGALAGAAIASFRPVDKTPPRPTEADTNSPAESCAGPAHDKPRSQSHPSR